MLITALFLGLRRWLEKEKVACGDRSRQIQYRSLDIALANLRVLNILSNLELGHGELPP